ncbi:hypothetical protein CC78DRAFT_341312, partial [Lojkania enalia]
MMSSYICRHCRSRLAQRAAYIRKPQWQPRATFISLRNDQSRPKPKDPVSSANSTESTRTEPPYERSAQDSEDKEYELSPVSIWQMYSQNEALRPLRYSQRVRDVSQVPVRNEKGEEGGRSFQSLRISLTPTDKSAASPILAMLDAGKLEGAWVQFNSVYTSRESPALGGDLSRQDIMIGPKLFVKLLFSVISDYCGRSSTSISPTDVLFKYEQLGIMQPEWWRNAIGTLTNEMLRYQSLGETNTPGAERVLTELLSVWKLFFHCKAAGDNSLDALSEGWSGLPSEIQSQVPSLNRDISRRLQWYHPKFVGSPTLGFSAVTVFNILNERNEYAPKLSSSLRKQAAPFFSFLTQLLFKANVQSVFKHTGISPGFRKLPKEFRKIVEDQVTRAPLEAMRMVASHNSTGAAITDDNQESDNLERFLLKRIQRAITQQSHTGVLDALWGEAVQAYTTKEQKTEIPPQIYNAFLNGYLALFKADRSVEVWNHMIASGIIPDVRAWVALLSGCERSRDLNGLEATWKRMIQSGTLPDEYAWTTRIHALIYLRQVKAGLGALQEMGNAWIAAQAAAKNPTDKNRKKSVAAQPDPIKMATKPTIEVINGAISALADLPPDFYSWPKKVDDIENILRWAGHFSMKPNARTYNTLIKLHLTHRDYNRVFSLLRQMEKEGIEPDIATYTMLIRATFGNEAFGSLSPDAQATHAISLLQELEDSGMKLNDYVYSTTIDRLLKRHDNFSAVRAIVDFMLVRDAAPSPQLFTSLITHYFQQSPPDVAAVDTLWLQISTNRGAPTDKILFDRLIEGYAGVGEIGKMMAVLNTMDAHGKLPGWLALRAVVRALAEKGEWERVRSVVRDVQDGVGVAR